MVKPAARTAQGLSADLVLAQRAGHDQHRAPARPLRPWPFPIAATKTPGPPPPCAEASTTSCTPVASIDVFLQLGPQIALTQNNFRRDAAPRPRSPRRSAASGFPRPIALGGGFLRTPTPTAPALRLDHAQHHQPPARAFRQQRRIGQRRGKFPRFRRQRRDRLSVAHARTLRQLPPLLQAHDQKPTTSRTSFMIGCAIAARVRRRRATLHRARLGSALRRRISAAMGKAAPRALRPAPA